MYFQTSAKHLFGGVFVLTCHHITGCVNRVFNINQKIQEKQRKTIYKVGILNFKWHKKIFVSKNFSEIYYFKFYFFEIFILPPSLSGILFLKPRFLE